MKGINKKAVWKWRDFSVNNNKNGWCTKAQVWDISKGQIVQWMLERMVWYVENSKLSDQCKIMGGY